MRFLGCLALELIGFCPQGFDLAGGFEEFAESGFFDPDAGRFDLDLIEGEIPVECDVLPRHGFD